MQIQKSEKMIDKPLLYFCKITVHTKFGNGKLVESFLWEGFKFQLFTKYQWYFRYRAALLQVKYPKYHVEKYTGPDKSRNPEEILKWRIRAKKAKITETKNKLQKARDYWDQLFPIEEDPLYLKAIAKLERLKSELKEMQQ